MDGTDFSNKLILYSSIFMLNGCISINFLSEYVGNNNKEFSISAEEIKNFDNNKHIISINNKDAEISYLNKTYFDKQIQRWSLDDEIFYILNNGKVVKTIGLENDLEIISYKNFLNEGIAEIDGKKSKAIIRFSNPESNYLKIFYTYKILNNGVITNIKNEKVKYSLIQESFNVPLIGWSGKNYYWIDSEKNILKTRQHIDPIHNQFLITFL
jgi:hypothetical protein